MFAESAVRLESAHAASLRATWRDIARADPGVLVSQTPEWIDVLCRSGYEDASRTYVTDGGNRMVLPLVRRRSSLPRALSPLTSLPSAWGVGGPIAERELTAADLTSILDDLCTLQAIRVTVRPNPLHARVWAQAAHGVPLVVLPRRAHVLDLSGGADEVWDRRFSATARRAVRRAELTALDVRVGSSAELLGDFRRLYELSVRRGAQQQHEPQALAMLRAYRRDPPAKFLHIAEALPDALRVWIAYLGSAPVAGLVVLLGTNASCVRGATDAARAGTTRANELLHWHAIEEACAAGCATYHFGDTGRSARLAEFSERLGARPVRCAAYCIERLPLHGPERAARASVKRAIGFRDAA